MIKSLRLENFGRFRGKAFSFAPVTVFSGNNETGKTTLFDSLLDAISSPKANTEHGKNLVKRYGKDRKVIPEFEGEPLSINEKDFMNLFAVRSGSISLEIEQNSQWMNQVKASLFSGGIDPGSIIEKLNDTVNSRAKGSLRSEEKAFKAELESLEAEKKRCEAIRKECFEEEKRIAGAGDRMINVRQEISRLTETCEELEKALSQQKLLQQEKVLNNILADIGEWRRNKDEQKKNARFDTAVFEDLKKKEAEVSQLGTEAEKAAALEEETRRTLAASIEEKAQYEKRKSDGDSMRLLAEHLLDTLVPREKLVQTKTIRIWRKPYFAMATILLAAGVLAFFLTAYGWVVLAAAIAAAGICAAAAQTHQSMVDTSGLDNAVSAAREKWKKETGEDLWLHYEELIAALGRAIERSHTVKEDYALVVTRTGELEKSAESYAAKKTQFGNAAAAAQSQIRGILEESGTTDINNYAARLETKKIGVERGRELDEKLKSALTDHGAASPEALEDIITRKISEISGKITREELTAAEQRARENQLQETKEKLEVLRREEVENTGSFREDKGTIRGRLRGLPEKIAESEKGIQEKKARLAEIEREFRAVKIAGELFASVAADSDLMLEKLSCEIAELFSGITEAGRKVQMENFSITNVSVDDAQGAGRESDILSAGTRDAFLLASRLTLARKSMDCKAIIVLDEPFLALDRPRTGRALSILKKFQAATLWQLVLFTKDEETVNQAREIFTDADCSLIIHSL